MYFKFIKFVVLLSLLVCCGFAVRVLYSRFFNLVVQGKDPQHNFTQNVIYFFVLRKLSPNIMIPGGLPLHSHALGKNSLGKSSKTPNYIDGEGH